MDFINATVERIIEFFKDHNCYLLADETGLGKTIETRELIYKMSKNQNLKVLYIAPNLVLAEKNKYKLVHKELKDKTYIPKSNRLTKLPEEEKPICYWAVTPAVSFFLDGGTKNEKDELKEKENELFSTEGHPEHLVENLKKLKERKDLCEQKRTINQGCSIDSKIIKNITMFLKKIGKDPIFEFSNDNYNKDKIALIEIIKNNAFRNKDLRNKVWNIKNKLMTHFIDRVSDWYSTRNSSDKERLLNESVDFYEKNRWNTLEYDYIKKYIYWLVHENIKFECDDLNDEIEKLKNDFVYCSWCNKLKNSGNDYSEIEYIITTYHYVSAFAAAFFCEEVPDDNYNLGRLGDSLSEDLKSLLIDNDLCVSDISALINGYLYDVYCKQSIYYLRLAACLVNVSQWNPDLVIFDEFQNYPGLFSKDNKTGTETENVKMIMDAVSTDSKVLMLSATPYSYSNLIPANDEFTDEDIFLKHIEVGMEDILAYMDNLNNVNDDVRNKHSQLFLDYHKQLNLFIESFSSDGGDAVRDRDKRYDDLCKMAKAISKELYSSGISRNERPTTSYMPSQLYITPKEVMTQPCDMITISSDNDEDTGRIRHGMSKPKYEKDGVSYIRVTSQKLLKEILPDDCIPPIFLPPVLGEEGQIHKMIAFSAYTDIPEELSELVNDRFNELLDNINAPNNLSSGDSTVFKDYLKEIIDKYIKHTNKVFSGLNGDGVNSLITQIVNRFKTVSCEKIIYKYFLKNVEKVKQEEYWAWVKKYCIDNQFDKVFDEFLFLMDSEYENEDEEFKWEKHFGKFTNDKYAVNYTSDSKISSSDLLNYINRFQSPFYPFCFFLSSVAQEGLDFHWYCDSIVHWNVPASPIAMLQREGRINRYRCYSLRKQLWKELREELSMEASKVNSMRELFDLAEKYSDRADNNGFYPNHISLSGKPLPINRKCYYYPLSEEHFRWNDLMINMEYYRSLFGGWSASDKMNDAIIDYIRNKMSDDEKSIMIDISPMRYAKKRVK